MQTLEDIIDDLHDTADGGAVTVGSILDAFENRPLGVLLALLGMLASIPVIGGLPGAPVVLCGFILAAIGQSVFAEGGLWAPARLRAVEIDSDRIEGAADKAKPWARRIDAVVKERLAWLATGRIAHGVIVACSAILALAFVPLGLVPWGVLVPAMAIAAFGLALTGKDGVFALFGYALVAVTALMGFGLL